VQPQQGEVSLHQSFRLVSINLSWYFAAAKILTKKVQIDGVNIPSKASAPATSLLGRRRKKKVRGVVEGGRAWSAKKCAGTFSRKQVWLPQILWKSWRVRKSLRVRAAARLVRRLATSTGTLRRVCCCAGGNAAMFATAHCRRCAAACNAPVPSDAGANPPPPAPSPCSLCEAASLAISCNKSANRCKPAICSASASSERFGADANAALMATATGVSAVVLGVRCPSALPNSNVRKRFLASSSDKRAAASRPLASSSTMTNRRKEPSSERSRSTPALPLLLLAVPELALASRGSATCA
jgi:hypothetical protein